MSETNENPLNPILFELRQVFISREKVEIGWGWEMRETNFGLVIERIEEETPSTTKLAVGDYLLSVNRCRVKTNEDVNTQIRQSPMYLALRIARRRPVPLDTATFLLSANIERRNGWEYVVCRLDQMSYPRLGMKVAMLAGRLAVLSLDSQGAAAACGLKVGDRILGIGETLIRDEQHFRRIVNVVQGDPIDVTVERRRISMASEMDPMSPECNPSLGIPDVPLELEKLMENVRTNIVKNPKPAESKTASSKSVDETEATKTLAKSKKRVTLKKPEKKKDDEA